MTAAEKQQHYQITVDCWRLLLKYQEPVSAQEYWERLVEDARKIAKRYEHLRFAEKTILAVLEEIDRIWRMKSDCGEIGRRAEVQRMSDVRTGNETQKSVYT